MGEGAQMKLAATQLVRRARQGDQNAVGMIVAVRENAKRGAPRARAMMRLLKREVERPRPKGRFGSEASSKTRADLVMLQIAASPTEELFVPRLAALVVPLGRRRVSVEAAARALAAGRAVRPGSLRALASRLSAREREAMVHGWRLAGISPERRKAVAHRYDRAGTPSSGAFRLGVALRGAASRQSTGG